MEENANRDKCRWKRRYADDGEVPIKCSGRHCRGCAAELIADCVAICCCPCSLVSLLTLAFIKVPWKLARMCLGSGKKKRKKVEIKREVSGRSWKSFCESSRGGVDCSFIEGRIEEETFKFFKGFRDEEEIWPSSARVEAEKVWFELDQLGHVGFGRVSSAEIPL